MPAATKEDLKRSFELFRAAHPRSGITLVPVRFENVQLGSIVVRFRIEPDPETNTLIARSRYPMSLITAETPLQMIWKIRSVVETYARHVHKMTASNERAGRKLDVERFCYRFIFADPSGDVLIKDPTTPSFGEIESDCYRIAVVD